MRVNRIILRTLPLWGGMLLPAAAQDSGKPSISAAIDVQPQQLLVRPVGANWLSYNGDYTGAR